MTLNNCKELFLVIFFVLSWFMTFRQDSMRNKFVSVTFLSHKWLKTDHGSIKSYVAFLLLTIEICLHWCNMSNNGKTIIDTVTCVIRFGTFEERKSSHPDRYATRTILKLCLPSHWQPCFFSTKWKPTAFASQGVRATDHLKTIFLVTGYQLTGIEHLSNSN